MKNAVDHNLNCYYYLLGLEQGLSNKLYHSINEFF